MMTGEYLGLVLMTCKDGEKKSFLHVYYKYMKHCLFQCNSDRNSEKYQKSKIFSCKTVHKNVV